MDDKTYIGALAEAKVIAKLTENRFHVFDQISGKAPFDLIAYKDNRLYRISVKGNYTGIGRGGSYEIQLARIRSNKTTNKIHKFESSECDVLAVYLHECDTVCFIKSTEITTGRSLSLRNSKDKHCTAGYRLISEHTDIANAIG